MQFEGAFAVAGAVFVVNAGDELGRNIRGGGDGAGGSQAQGRVNEGIAAHNDIEVIGELANVIPGQGQVPGGILDADDIGDVHQFQHGLESHRDLGAARVGVHQDGQIGFRRDVLVVLDQFGLGGGHEVGGEDRKSGYPAHFLNHMCGLNAIAGGDFRGAGVDRDPAIGLFHGDFNNAALLSVIEAVDFTGAAEHENTVHAVGDRVVNDVAQTLLQQVSFAI